MNIVLKAIAKVGSQQKLADKLTLITGHPYKQGHIGYWKQSGQFPAELAYVVASDIFDGEVTAFEACPGIKRAVNNG